MYWDSIDHHIGDAHLEAFWMSHPRVRAAINERVAGDPGVWPLEWFRKQYESRLPFRNALSVGVGTGGLERDLLAKGIVERVTGIDVVEQPLEFARTAAVDSGDRISYVRADARAFLAERPATFDAIFFHASLHHFDRLDELLRIVRDALTPGGILYLDEYVGPAMKEWNVFRLALPNIVYYALPPKLRRPKLVRTPINREDPTEAIEASSIIPAVERHLQVLDRRNYGGNLVALIYPNLHRSDSRRLDRAVRFMLRCEDFLLKSSHHAVIVAQRPSGNVSV
jgi:SAM-dependent methyltransferase